MLLGCNKCVNSKDLSSYIGKELTAKSIVSTNTRNVMTIIGEVAANSASATSLFLFNANLVLVWCYLVHIVYYILWTVYYKNIKAQCVY